MVVAKIFFSLFLPVHPVLSFQSFLFVREYLFIFLFSFGHDKIFRLRFVKSGRSFPILSFLFFFQLICSFFLWILYLLDFLFKKLHFLVYIGLSSIQKLLFFNESLLGLF